ncbi:MAG: phosphodiester glycosidase family protein [Nocardioidaceae bacterium]|nr:phosphodiester glycosidase family protein [Nocardioidaceae bacterium]MCL2612098.1 phosphodiester glycosidase family protein [Nocardioidaceae bacterium]
MRRLPTLLALTLASVLAPAGVAVADHASTQGAGSDGSGQPVRRHPRDSNPHTWQTSDRIIGPDLPSAPSYARAAGRTKRRFQYDVRPGVRVSSYQETIGSRSLRYYVVRANWKDKGVGFQLAQPPKIDRVQTVRWMTHNTPHAIAGVNGDFFDIGETGAPLGLGVRNGQVEHGIDWGWNSAFWIDEAGNPHIGTVPMTITDPQRPKLGLTNLNSPQVRPGGIGVYDGRWGTTGGYLWTQRQRKHIAMAHVVDHKVVGFQKVYKAGQKITGRYLVARGQSAVDRLHRLRKGENIWFAASAAHNPRLAVTGSTILLRSGKVVATDNKELHPRTAIGIDPYHHWVFLLVVEGRQEFSDGYTEVEEARKLKQLGCKSALNFDGGGSTTLAALRDGDLRVLNSPSDGQQRKVGNALTVTYQRPHKKGKRRR